MRVNAIACRAKNLDIDEMNVVVGGCRKRLRPTKEAIDHRRTGIGAVAVDRQVLNGGIVRRLRRPIGIGFAAVGSDDTGHVVAGRVVEANGRQTNPCALERRVVSNAKRAGAGVNSGCYGINAGRQFDRPTSWVGSGFNESSNVLKALVGAAPFNADSGGVRGERRIQGGRAPLRQALYMAAQTGYRHNPCLKPFYQRLRAKGKSHKQAVVACIAKLVSIMNAIIKTGKPFNAATTPA